MQSKPIKRLGLNKETIRSLTPTDLDGVAGGTTSTVIIASVAISYVSAVSYAIYTETKHKQE